MRRRIRNILITVVMFSAALAFQGCMSTQALQVARATGLADGRAEGELYIAQLELQLKGKDKAIDAAYRKGLDEGQDLGFQDGIDAAEQKMKDGIDDLRQNR